MNRKRKSLRRILTVVACVLTLAVGKVNCMASNKIGLKVPHQWVAPLPESSPDEYGWADTLPANWITVTTKQPGASTLAVTESYFSAMGNSFPSELSEWNKTVAGWNRNKANPTRPDAYLQSVNKRGDKARARKASYLKSWGAS